MILRRRRSMFCLGFLLCVALQTASAASSAESTAATQASAGDNFNCPRDCHCNLAQHTHTPLLHAKCSSLDGLKSEEPLKASLPIHSIDLSHLRLARLSHSLEKLHDVTSVDLSYNELHEIGHLGRRIKKLNLKHNRLTSAKLAKLPQHVQVLNLEHNDITYLPLEFTKLSHLQTLQLSHNEINCSCETLEVRNWLQERNVFMEHPVICSSPAAAKGKPWLQLKQSDFCKPASTTDNDWLADEQENELMMGDQPYEGSADNDGENDDEELGKDFMPLEHKSVSASVPNASELGFNDVEGSGDMSAMNMEQKLASTPHPDEEEEDDGSGSGGGPIIIPAIAAPTRLLTDEFETKIHNEAEPDDADDFDKRPLEAPAPEPTPSPDIFGNGMGIFDGETNGGPVEEKPIVPIVHHADESGVITDGTIDDDSSEQNDDLQKASVSEADDSNAIYFLLGVIVFIVIGLIFYVAVKRCKQRRLRQRDAENPPQTELLDMDKKNLGKPVQRNGKENAPLIGEKSKADMAKPVNGTGKKPYDDNDVRDGPATQQQPLLNGNGTNGAAAPVQEDIPTINVPSLGQGAPHEYYPITPRYPPPKSPRASKYAQYPQSGEPNNNEAEPYSPSSPKTGRYSPVYSPETGRVKIKLSETPRPKTPMLVTRTKSNAGDIITTPVRGLNPAEAPAVHVAH